MRTRAGGGILARVAPTASPPPEPPADPDDAALVARLRADVEHLAPIERLPCSAGEREAAEWIAARLRDAGADAELEEDPVHGTYTTPLGLAAGAAAGAGALAVHVGGARLRALATVVGAGATGLVVQDLAGGPRRWLRRALPQRTTTHVHAEVGDRAAPRTVVVHAHHDAARTSFLFDQTVPRLVVERLPGLAARIDRWPPMMVPVVAGPALVALGAALGRRGPLRAGTTLGLGTAVLMAHMRTRPVVPGANDNLTGVAVLLELARGLRDRPIPGLRVVLLSAGAEESNQDGMLAWAARHLPALPPRSTTFLCLDSVGSPDLTLLEGEGFLRMHEYPEATKALVADAAREAGVALQRGLRFTFATDGLVPLRRGYPCASVGSLNEHLVPTNYHMPADRPEGVHWRTVADAVRVSRGVLERVAARAA